MFLHKNKMRLKKFKNLVKKNKIDQIDQIAG